MPTITINPNIFEASPEEVKEAQAYIKGLPKAKKEQAREIYREIRDYRITQALCRGLNQKCKRAYFTDKENLEACRKIFWGVNANRKAMYDSLLKTKSKKLFNAVAKGYCDDLYGYWKQSYRKIKRMTPQAVVKSYS